MQTLKCKDQGLLTGMDKTGTNIRINDSVRHLFGSRNMGYTSNKLTDEPEKV